MSQSIAAVVVTYNRKVLLLECLDALLAQSVPVAKIILIDNASTDGTPELLAEKGYLDNPAIQFTRMGSNTGGAGGFHEGVKQGFEAGYDWLWLMDDDAEPARNAVELMQPHFGDTGLAAIANLKVGSDGIPQYEHRGWFDRDPSHRALIRAITADDISQAPSLEIDHASFVGIAISRLAVAQVGLPNRDFFIHCDDVEYCVRLRTVGRIVLLRDSVVYHKNARPVGLQERQFMGRSSPRMPIDRLWITYFSERNLIVVKGKLLGTPAFVFFALQEFFRDLRRTLGIVVFDDRKLARLRFLWGSFFDALSGTFDNAKPRRILDGKK